MRVRDENKEAIVRQEALKMLVEKGFDGFSMQKLAKEAGVSPATLYIYFKDKDDLIVQLGLTECKRMTEATMKDFSPDMSFEEGLRIQWRNRASYCLENSLQNAFFEQIKNSPFKTKIWEAAAGDFRGPMCKFCERAIANKELAPMPLEVYWSIAFAPLYNLLRFHQTGKSLGNKDFVLTQELMDQTLARVLRALKP